MNKWFCPFCKLRINRDEDVIIAICPACIEEMIMEVKDGNIQV